MSTQQDDSALNPSVNNNTEPTDALLGGYKSRQYGCFWILLFVGSLMPFFQMGATAIYEHKYGDRYEDMSEDRYTYQQLPLPSNLTNVIITTLVLLSWAVSTIWIDIEDCRDYLQITYGPLRFLLCGMGKEKIYYTNIRDYQVSKSCFYGFGLPCCTSIKLFNTCSVCCGDMAHCCGHKTIKLSIKERVQGQYAAQNNDNCCMEQCFLKCCCGEKGEYIGKGGCCKCCNPCDANFCMMNTVFVSTNDVNGLLRLLNEKVSGNGMGENQPLLSDEAEDFAVI